MPIDYKRHPPDWKQRRARILARAGNCCERCGTANYSVRAGAKIVLTIAHLDHDETNFGVSDERLQALCQRCHTRYDAPEKARRLKQKKYKNSLFPI